VGIDMAICGGAAGQVQNHLDCTWDTSTATAACLPTSCLVPRLVRLSVLKKTV
jgi:hypothetical protein